MTRSLRVWAVAACLVATTQLPGSAAPVDRAAALSPLTATDLDAAPHLSAATRTARPSPRTTSATNVVSRPATGAQRVPHAIAAAPSGRKAGSPATAGAAVKRATRPSARAARPVRTTASAGSAPSTGRLNWSLTSGRRPAPVPEPEAEPASLQTKMLQLQRLAASLPADQLAEQVLGPSAAFPLPGFGAGIGGACYPTNRFTIAPGGLSALAFGFGSALGDLQFPSAPPIDDAQARVLYFYNSLTLGNTGAPFSASGGFMQGALVAVVLWSNPARIPTVFASTCVVQTAIEVSGSDRTIRATLEGLVLGLPGQSGFSAGVATFAAGVSAAPGVTTDVELGLDRGTACLGTTPSVDLTGVTNGLLRIPSLAATAGMGSLPIGVTPGPAPCPGIVL
ncbi:MAG: hypothetical protein ACRDJM_10505 [Actinomycetota bacterium]